jgi:hypothetical protein
LLQLLERIVGLILGFLVLMDIFLLVLHARADIGSISRWISLPIWRRFVALSRPLGKAKGRFLSFTGPVILVTVLASWFFLLTLAAALIIHPSLGTGIKNVHGETQTTFDRMKPAVSPTHFNGGDKAGFLNRLQPKFTARRTAQV